MTYQTYDYLNKKNSQTENDDNQHTKKFMNLIYTAEK